MALRLERKGYKVKILCTDGYEGYASYKLMSRHVVSKAKMSLVESKILDQALFGKIQQKDSRVL